MQQRWEIIKARHQRGKRLSAFVTDEAKFSVDPVKRGNCCSQLLTKCLQKLKAAALEDTTHALIDMKIIQHIRICMLKFDSRNQGGVLEIVISTHFQNFRFTFRLCRKKYFPEDCRFSRSLKWLSYFPEDHRYLVFSANVRFLQNIVHLPIKRLYVFI